MQEISDARYLAKSVAGLKPSGIRKFFDIVATMKEVISLGIGEPDFTTPEPILEAGIRSLRAGGDSLHIQFGKAGIQASRGRESRSPLRCKV